MIKIIKKKKNKNILNKNTYIKKVIEYLRECIIKNKKPKGGKKGKKEEKKKKKKKKRKKKKNQLKLKYYMLKNFLQIKN